MCHKYLLERAAAHSNVKHCVSLCSLLQTFMGIIQLFSAFRFLSWTVVRQRIREDWEPFSFLFLGRRGSWRCLCFKENQLASLRHCYTFSQGEREKKKVHQKIIIIKIKKWPFGSARPRCGDQLTTLTGAKQNTSPGLGGLRGGGGGRGGDRVRAPKGDSTSHITRAPSSHSAAPLCNNMERQATVYGLKCYSS